MSRFPLIRIERKGEVLAHAKVGEVFGEISFLEGVAASANVVADLNSNNPVVELYVIDGSTLKKLLALKPGIVLIQRYRIRLNKSID